MEPFWKQSGFSYAGGDNTATIASTITLRDNMTAVLNRQADAANTLLHRFTNLDRTTESYDPSGHFISANSAIAEMNANLGVQTTLLQQQNSLLANMVEQSAAAAREANKTKDAWGDVGSAIKAAMSFLSVKAIKNFTDTVFGLSNTQLKAEVQLATVMNNQGSGIADFEAIKARASDIQGKTMFGDEAMISGAAELSTYISDTEAISHMMGTLSNYAAGMSGGAEVGVEAMTEYATQLGKALDGTYDGLKKKGFELTEEQQKIIENGTDMQKALVLDEVINQSWAGLAENMRNTPTGAITSLNNTIGDIGETIGARITPAFMTLADKVESFVNSSGFESFVDSLVGVLTTLFDVLSWGAVVVQWAADNWNVLGPALLTAAAALAVYKTGTAIASAAQAIFNGSLLACPVTWIVLGIVALVAALAVFTNHVNQAYGLSLSFSGMLGGVLMVTLAALGNMVIGIYNFVIEHALAMWNYIAEFVNFIANVWTDPLGSVVRLFVGVFDAILSVVESAAGAIGSLFGQDWSSGIQGFRDEMNAAVEDTFGKGAVDVTVDEKMLSLDYISYDDAFDAGYYLGDNLFGGGNSSGLTGYDPTDYIFDSTPTGTADDPIHTSVDNDVNIADEDLQLMRDVAEARYVQNFVTLTPTVQVSGNTINEKVDVNTVVDEIENRLTNEIAASAEGIYE